ncbi:Tetratricopeptide repeat-containing protein [Spirosomataceae bacterium TFI 002]|nr:Tetratricopeptide repeat-containing protein [Spirosomataceae bacterium TFI 002]
MAKKDKSGNEIFESAEALQKEFVKAESFVEKNKTILLGIVGVLVAAVAIFFGYKYYNQTQDTEAQAAMFDSVYYFEQDSLDLALNGTGGNAGLLEIADSYGSTPAGNLANFYVGTIYLQQGKFDEAIEHLSNYSSSDLVLQGKAYCLIGDANMEKGNTSEAISAYKKAADYKPNKFITPGYLMKLATAYETANETDGALEAYSKLVEQYPNANESLTAKKYKSMLEAQAGE